MRCFIAEGRGVYLSAYAIIFAPDSDTAFEQALELFSENGIPNTRSEIEIREIPTDGASLIWNGDY